MKRLTLPALALVLATAPVLARQDHEALRDELAETREQLAQAREELRQQLDKTAPELRFRRAIRGFGGPRLGLVLDRDEEGLYLTGVTPSSAAAEAGLQTGDRIVSISGSSVTIGADATLEGIREMVWEASEEAPLKIEAERDGELLEFEVTPRKRPVLVFSGLDFNPEGIEAWARDFAAGIDLDKLAENVEEWTDDIPGHLSRSFRLPGAFFSPLHLELAENSVELGEYFGTADGVVVLKPDTRNDLGLKAGDVILQVNGTGLERPGDFHRQLRGLETGDALQLEIMRHGRLEILEAEVPEGRGPGMGQRRVKVLRVDGA